MVLARPRVFGAVGLVVSALGVGACRGAPDRAQDHHHERTLPPVGTTFAVRFLDRSVSVELSALPRDGGPGAISMQTLWRAAFPEDELAALHVDVVGSDGFRPGSRPKCTVPLTGAQLARATMDSTSHDLSFPAEMSLPGCYRVRAVVAVEASR